MFILCLHFAFIFQVLRCGVNLFLFKEDLQRSRSNLMEASVDAICYWCALIAVEDSNANDHICID